MLIVLTFKGDFMLEDNYPGYNLIRNFNPKGKTFVFNLSKYDCYRLSKGKCSIQFEQEKYKDESNSIYCKECDYRYCISLAHSLKEKGVTNNLSPVRITRNSCGHYAITDGQHRLCLAANANIKLDVYVQDYDGQCRVCYWKKKSIKYRIKDIIKKNDEFLRRL
jgi:hypothetical protein